MRAGTTSETKIIEQPNAPIKIVAFSAIYEGSRASYVERGIHYEVNYENTSSRNVVAIEFGLVAFDIWK